MALSTSKQSFVCGAFDALLVVAVVVVTAAASGISPVVLFTQKAWLLLAFVLPVALIVGWRGAAHAKQLLQGKRNWRQPVAEGFIAGFLIIPITHAIGMVSEAIAAGPPWPGLGAPAEYWPPYLWVVFQFSAALGAVGALGAALISGVNRALLSALASQQGIQPDGPASGGSAG